MVRKCKKLTRKIVHDYVVYFRKNPVTARQIMTDLSAERVTPKINFDHTGADFCSPFEIKYKNQRKDILHMIYVAIFICLMTNAIHLALFTDLTSHSYIASLKRFICRRGKYSSTIRDIATYFKVLNQNYANSMS